MASGTKKSRVDRCVQRYWWVALMLIILLPLAFYFRSLLPVPPNIQVTFDRTYSSESAHLALQAAELANYSMICDLPPFMFSGDDLNNPDYQEYIWINYINNATLGYIQNRILNKTGSIRHPEITFGYVVNASWYVNASFRVYSDSFIVRNETSGQEVFWELYGGNYLVRYYVNGSYQEEYPGMYPIHTQDVGMVYFHLYYSEYYGLLAAFYTGVMQIVLTNSSGQITYVLVSNLGPMIS